MASSTGLPCLMADERKVRDRLFRSIYMGVLAGLKLHTWMQIPKKIDMRMEEERARPSEVQNKEKHSVVLEHPLAALEYVITALVYPIAQMARHQGEPVGRV